MNSSQPRSVGSLLEPGSSPQPAIRQATRAYERWLAQQIPLLPGDLRLKHQAMRESLFAFLRATFYRWSQLWPAACPALSSAPLVLGVGDLHVENFGTWRDAEGRLIWGVNDFDEACWLAWPNDLVRLAVSAQFAVREYRLSCDLGSICGAILAGYTDCLEAEGKPFVLAERHVWLREVATGDLRDPVRFWDKLDRWKDVTRMVPKEVALALKLALPEPGLRFRVVHRQAGLGSLGRRRFTAIAKWHGGLIAREAKELAATAWDWHQPGPARTGLYYDQILQQAVRVPDPFVKQHGKWLMRRLAPDCSRIEFAALLKVKEELKLLQAMGWETANIHLGTARAAKDISAHLRRLPPSWLIKATTAMLRVVSEEWKQWRAG